MLLRLKIKKSAVSLMLFILLLLTAACSTMTNENEKSLVVDDEQLENAENINQLADIIYNHVNEENLVEARKGLHQLSEQVTNIRFQGLTTIEGMQALIASVISAKEIFNAIQYSQQEGLKAVGKVRLATDALTNPKNPMWLGYYKILKNDGDQLRKALETDQPETIGGAMVRISEHYSMIRPAALMNREPSEVHKIDSFITHLNTLNTDSISSVLDQYDSLLIEFFRVKSSTAYLPLDNQQNPLIWIITIGSIIVSVLSFVGWRRYRIEQDLIAVQQTKQRDKGW